MTTAAPTSPSTRAFSACSSPRAPGSGTRIAGRPTYANSAMVPAPARPTTRSAAANGLRKYFPKLREIARVRVCTERTGLVNDLRMLEDAREQRGNSLVQRTCASCPAGDIDDRDRAVKSEALQPAGADAGCQSNANGIAGYYHATVKPSRDRFCLAVRDGEDLSESRVDAVGESEDRRLLVR